MKSKIKIAIVIIILLLSAIMIVGSRYYSTVYAGQTFDQIIFYLFNGIEGTSGNVVKSVIKGNIFSVIFVFIIFIIDIKKKLIFKFKIKGKELGIQLFPIKITSNHKVIYSLLVLFISILIFIRGFGIDEFIKNLMQETRIYEEHYVSGNSLNIEFPEKKRNLIFISLESMETTLCSKENGGSRNYSLIPELEELALENINFSYTQKLGGACQVANTNFTIAGLVAQTAGIPLRTTVLTVDESSGRYEGNGRYLEKAYTLGDILKEQGYNSEIMMGSNGSFGGRKQYFETNGDYKVYDLYMAMSEGKMTDDDFVWWGFDDDSLFEWAKEEILKLADEGKPFNFMLETADTHFPDGYLSKNAEIKYDTQYENVFAYSSKLTYEFVKWIQEQDFYKDTTIVILGDHLGMQSDFYQDFVDQNYQRGVYNVIINSAIEESNTKNRQFCSMDFYPTILASMGVKIEGNRLGLGTNLFSGEQTLIEKFGFDYFNGEMKKKSTFYNSVFLGRDYYDSLNL